MARYMRNGTIQQLNDFTIEGRGDEALKFRDDSRAAFIVQDMDVESVREYFGDKASDYDAFFALIEDGDYLAVWGMHGTVPYLDRMVWRVL